MTGAQVRRPTSEEWSAAAGVLAGAGSVALACHVGPDGDALGSMLGLGAALRARGTDVVASWGGEPFEVPAAYSFLPALDLLVPADRFPHAPELMVTFDSGSADRLGSLEDRVTAAAEVLVIDHHPTNTRYGTINLIDPAAAATAFMVAQLLDLLGLPLTAEVAAPLYTGLVTDTGSFKYAATTADVHQLAARLLATGIRHDLISRAIWDTQPFAYLQLLGAAAARSVLECGAARGAGLVWTTISAADFRAAGLGMADVEGVIDVVRATHEAEVAAVLKQEPDGSAWRLSVRSKGGVDVGAVCASLGGGGHLFAAGLTWLDGPEALLDVLRRALDAAPRLAT